MSESTLNLPQHPLDVREDRGKRQVYDPIRRRYVLLTPEEWIRQNFVQFLVHDRDCPQGLMSIEYPFQFEGRQRRADIVVSDRDGKPLVLVECKASSVAVGQAVFDQIARYNQVVGARMLVVTNGLVHYCYTIEAADGGSVTFNFHNDLPSYEELLGWPRSAGRR